MGSSSMDSRFLSSSSPDWTAMGLKPVHDYKQASVNNDSKLESAKQNRGIQNQDQGKTLPAQIDSKPATPTAVVATAKKVEADSQEGKAPPTSFLSRMAKVICKACTGLEADKIEAQLGNIKNSILGSKEDYAKLTGSEKLKKNMLLGLRNLGFVAGVALSVVGRIAALATGAALGIGMGLAIPGSVIGLLVVAANPEVLGDIFSFTGWLGERMTRIITKPAEMILTNVLELDKEDVKEIGKETSVEEMRRDTREFQKSLCVAGAVVPMILVILASKIVPAAGAALEMFDGL